MRRWAVGVIGRERMPAMEVVGTWCVWDGTRRSREAPIDEEGRNETRAKDRDGESKRTQRRTSPLLVRRRGEADEMTVGGNAGGGVLYIMVVLRVDVVKSLYFNPKVQTDASFLIKVGFN